MDIKFNIGDRVQPVSNGEDQHGRTLHWTKLRGVVLAVWTDGTEQRVQVRWDRWAPLGTRLPAYLLTQAT